MLIIKVNDQNCLTSIKTEHSSLEKRTHAIHDRDMRTRTSPLIKKPNVAMCGKLLWENSFYLCQRYSQCNNNNKEGPFDSKERGTEKLAGLLVLVPSGQARTSTPHTLVVSVSHYMLNSKETEVALNLDPLLSESSVL